MQDQLAAVAKPPGLESRILFMGPVWSPAETGHRWKEQQQSPSSPTVFPGPSSLPDPAKAPALQGAPQEGILFPGLPSCHSQEASLPLCHIPASPPSLRHGDPGSQQHRLTTAIPAAGMHLPSPEDAIPCTKEIMWKTAADGLSSARCRNG